MPTTIARPLTNGSGVALNNGSAVPLYEAGLGAGDIINLLGGGINWNGIADAIAAWLGTDRLTLANAILALLAAIPGIGSIINQVTSEGILAIVSDLAGMNSSTPLAEPGSKLTLGNIRQAETALGNDLAAISTQISGLPAPPTPPSTGDIATAVWTYSWGAPLGEAQTHLGWAGEFAFQANNRFAFPLLQNPQFVVRGAFTDFSATTSLGRVPAPSWSDIRTGDTRLSWLARTDGAGNWSADPVTNEPRSLYNQATPDVHWYLYPRISEGEFRAIWLAQSVNLAPIWPGAAGAVDGTPVVVTAPQLVVGPMHGCHVTIDSVAPGTGDEPVGTHHNRKWAGWIAFVSDVGEVEQFQYLNQNLATYCPKSMAQAASVLVFLRQASQVTVTPWLLA